MRILLTGGNGQVGWELRRSLAGLGEVIAPARTDLDLAATDSIAAAVRLIRPDLIVNAGAYTAVDKAESEADLAMRVNGIAPRVLAEEAMRSGAMIVHYSTDYVFNGEKPGAYVEDDLAAPLNVYGRTKLAGERAIAEAGGPHLIFRTTWIYGPRGQNFFLTMSRLFRERKELTIVNDQFGAPTPARFVADATAVAIQKTLMEDRLGHDRFRPMGGIYHMTASGRTNWYDFAVEILRGQEGGAALRPIPSADYPTPAKRPRNSLLDNARLQQVFGISLPDWKAGLRLCQEEFETARKGA